MGVTEKVERTRARGKGRGKVVWNDAGLGDLDLEVRRVKGEVEQEGGGLVWGLLSGWTRGRFGGRGLRGGSGRRREVRGGDRTYYVITQPFYPFFTTRHNPPTLLHQSSPYPSSTTPSQNCQALAAPLIG